MTTVAFRVDHGIEPTYSSEDIGSPTLKFKDAFIGRDVDIDRDLTVDGTLTAPGFTGGGGGGGGADVPTIIAYATALSY